MRKFLVRMSRALSEQSRPARATRRTTRRECMRGSYAVVVLIAAATAAFSTQAVAQAYPARPIRLIVPFPPGGGFDGIARPFSEKLSTLLGQPIVVENRPGAGGNIGAATAARATPDGYTLLFGNNFLATNPPMYKAPGYDSLKDFVPVTTVGSIKTVLAVNPSLPAKDLKELMALSKAKPLTHGTQGVGTQMHLVGEMMNQNGVLRLLHVPYKGSGLAVNDTVGGQIDMVMISLVSVAQHIRAGRLRSIAVMSATRAPSMPDVPTFVEAGGPAMNADLWYGLFAVAGTPEPVLKRLNEASVEALRQPDLIERLKKAGYEPGSSTPEALTAILKADLDMWQRVVRDANIPPE
jgi:tripartite-type tricarboxylate transporter receptor subunit TctC